MTASVPGRDRTWPAWTLPVALVALVVLIAWFVFMAAVSVTEFNLNWTLVEVLVVESAVPGATLTTLLLVVGFAVYRSRRGPRVLFEAFAVVEILALGLSVAGAYLFATSLALGFRATLVPELVSLASAPTHGVALLLLFLLARPAFPDVPSMTGVTGAEPGERNEPR